MVKTDLLRKYEIAVLLDSKLGQSEKDGIIKEVADAVSKAGGKVINTQLWLDKHKSFFRIKKVSDVSYYLVNFESASEAVSQINQSLRLNENILRFLVSVIE